MKKILFILLLLPFFAFAQPKGTHRVIITDSIKALTGGVVDFKDTSRFEKMVSIGGLLDTSAILTLTDTAKGFLIPRLTTVQRNAVSAPATGLLIFNTVNKRIELFETSWKGVGNGFETDSSFVVIMFDTAEAFNNNNIQFKDTVIFQRHVEVDSSFQVNDGQTLLKGIDASTNKFALKVQDNVGTELFNVRNDGKVGIGTDNPTAILHLQSAASTLLVVGTNGNAILNLQSEGAGVIPQINLSVGGVGKMKISMNLVAGYLTFESFENQSLGLLFTAKSSSESVANLLISNAGIIEISRARAATSGEDLINSPPFLFTARFWDGIANLHSFEIEHIMETTAPTSRLAFSINSNEYLSIKNSGKIGIGVTDPSEKLEINGSVIIDSTLFIKAIIVHDSLVIKRECSVIADDGTIILPDATTQSLLIWVDGDDEWAQCAIQTDGAVTILTSVGSVVNTDTDTNLAIFDSGTGATIRNRLGSSKTVCFETKYKL